MKKIVKQSRAYKYALWCVKDKSGKVGKYVKKQAADMVKVFEGKHPYAVLDVEEMETVNDLLAVIQHPDLNKSLLDGLEPYALLMLTAVFAVKDKKTGDRYYTGALLEIARKNFKTFTSAVIFVISMLRLPKYARLYSVAPDLKLSSELKEAIKKLVGNNPLLTKYFRVLRSEIRCTLTDTNYIPLAYSKDKMDGKLAYLFLADECGAMDSYPIEAMRSSQITLQEPLGIVISTQYPNDDNALKDELLEAKRQLDNPNKRYNHSVFALLYEPDEEIINEWETNDNVIYQANPAAIDNKRIFQELIARREEAVLYPSRKENFLCKHLNIKYRGVGSTAYVDIQDLKQCKIEENPDFWKGKEVFLGLDLSLSDDNTAVAMVYVDDENNIYSKVWGFLPTERLEIKSKKEELNYQHYCDKGYCFACGDEVIDYGFVEDFILSLESTYGVQVVQIGYDIRDARSTAQKIERQSEGRIQCVIVQQHSRVTHPATKWLYEAVLKKTFHYEENELLEVNFSNARCSEDTNLNKYVNKKASNRKVDMVVSIINALVLVCAIQAEEVASFGAQF